MAKKLKKLMQEGTVVLPGAFNGISARLVEEAGFRALYISGAGLANGVAAMPDVGLLTLTEVIAQASYITNAVNIPCIADGETGFGESVNVVRMVEEMERIGAAGVHIEDQILPKKCGHLSGKDLILPEDMAEKIAAAVEARNDPEFLIIARTDARGVEGFDEAVKRAVLYIDAGADVIFPEALESREEFRLFAEKVKAPLLANMTEFGRTPYMTVKDFGEMGYRMVIFPLTAFRVMIRSVKDALGKLKAEGTQQGFLEKMLHRKELYKILGYKDYEDIDQKVWDEFHKED